VKRNSEEKQERTKRGLRAEVRRMKRVRVRAAHVTVGGCGKTTRGTLKAEHATENNPIVLHFQYNHLIRRLRVHITSGSPMWMSS
jgi:hypothetical protein